MNPPIDRRAFLKQAAAAGLIVGFPLAAAGEERAINAVLDCERPEAPVQQPARAQKGMEIVHRTPREITPLAPDEVVRRTLSRMKEEKKPGLVFLYPADGQLVAALTACLTSMVEAKSAAAHQVFAEAVLACVPAQEAGRFDGRRDGCNVLLIDHADGKAVDGELIDFKTPDALPRRLLSLLHGRANSRLQVTSALQRRALPEERRRKIDAAVAELSDVDYRVRTAAADRLVELSAGATAVLAYAAAGAEDPEVSGQLALVFSRLSGNAGVRERSPIGTVWVEEHVDPCPPCGMAAVPSRSRAFLQLICQPSAGGNVNAKASVR